jgi:hypothetical protein
MGSVEPAVKPMSPKAADKTVGELRILVIVGNKNIGHSVSFYTTSAVSILLKGVGVPSSV